MSKSYFFYGVVDGDVPEDTWQALHAHFEKLAREDGDGGTQVITSNHRARKKEGVRE